MKKYFDQSFWRMASGFVGIIIVGLLTIYLLQVLLDA